MLVSDDPGTAMPPVPPYHSVNSSSQEPQRCVEGFGLRFCGFSQDAADRCLPLMLLILGMGFVTTIAK